MQIIRSVEIRKFRSIKSVTGTSKFNPTHLNVIVGKNDQGKSNVLRALNLFFNNETDSGVAFRFDDDYCYRANTGTGTRREVRIDLVIDPPKARFKNAKAVRWTKRWKRDGSVVDERTYLTGGAKLASSSNISKWLDKLRYRYIPAIRGNDYFENLMGELYDVLNDAHKDLLDSQGNQFITGIQGVTEEITLELNSQLGMANTIQVPSDFKVLFANLDFGTAERNLTYYLKQRGDGIKVRHIPVILKYMGDQERNVSIPGYVKPDTIWGFEEPENNLEMSFAMELSKKFMEYAKDIQIFLTTHSPAFYGLNNDVNKDFVATFYVEQDEDACTKINPVSELGYNEIDSKMGALPQIAAYLESLEAQQETIDSLSQTISKAMLDRDVIVLTEDAISPYLATLLEVNGAQKDDYHLWSYEGADQLRNIWLCVKLLKQQSHNVQILIHRDRDYYTNDEIKKIEKRATEEGASLFVTSGVDVESHFLDAKHIVSLYPGLSVTEVRKAILEATTGTAVQSIKKFTNSILKNKANHPQNNDWHTHYQEIQKKFADDPTRYRHGKTVLNELRRILQNQLKTNIYLNQPSEHLRIEFLQRFFEGIR